MNPSSKTKRVSRFSAKLKDYKYYESAIERLHAKFSKEMPFKLYELQPEGFSFTNLFDDRKKVSKLLARDVSKGQYVFSPVHRQEIIRERKKRIIYRGTLMDRIIHLAVFAMLAEDMQQLFPPEVYSYRKGRDRTDAVESFLRYVRTHKTHHKTPKTRGLYVYRFDIKSYGESIPVDSTSPLWQMLRDFFEHSYGAQPQPLEWNLLVSMIRPQVIRNDREPSYNLIGIPDGAPITSLLLNLYVSPLDHYLRKIRNGVYARYGDDILFAHDDLKTFQQTVEVIDSILTTLSLRKNTVKTKAVFFNAAGREKDGVKGSNVVEYLGMQLHFDGTAALIAEKQRDVLSDIQERLKLTASQIKTHPLEERGRLLCDVVNQALNPGNAFVNPYAMALRKLVNHRGQLKDIDYQIARLVVKVLTGDSSVKQFRNIPIKKLRTDWHLVSLEYIRNQ